MRSLSRAPRKPRLASRCRCGRCGCARCWLSSSASPNHFGHIGAICNDASFAMMLAHRGVLRERVLRAAHAAFGHRLMRDIAVPGGVAKDIDASGIAAIRDMVAAARLRFPPLVKLYDNTASLQDRSVGSGVLRITNAARHSSSPVAAARRSLCGAA
jgi:Ni,Fe-hydrogenase III large subunit